MAESKYSRRKITAAPPISEETATGQVAEMLEYYDIDPDKLTSGSEDESKNLEKALDHVRDVFRAGTLELARDKDEKLIIVHHLRGGEKLEYREISAKAKLAMEKFPSGAGYSRIYAFMGSLAGVGKAGIEKLSSKDLSVVEVLGAVFSNA